MALTDHYDLRYVEADDEMSEFPGTWTNTVDKLDTAIYEAATGNVDASRLTGTIANARIASTIARTADVETIDEDLTARVDESRRLIGINDEYLSSALNRVDTLETDVPALDDRVTTLEQSSGGGGGDGGSVYDSGVREVNDLFPGAVMYHPTNSQCTMSRYGPMVTLTLSSFNFDGSGNVEMGDIPEGFRPPSTLRFDALSQGEDNIQMAVRGSSNDLWAYGVPSGATGYTAHIVYRTPDPAPTDLPGNAA